MTQVIRKARKNGLIHNLTKYGKKIVFVWSVPVARYSILPAMAIFALYYSEPSVSINDLLNPFF